MSRSQPQRPLRELAPTIATPRQQRGERLGQEVGRHLGLIDPTGQKRQHDSMVLAEKRSEALGISAPGGA